MAEAVEFTGLYWTWSLMIRALAQLQAGQSPLAMSSPAPGDARSYAMHALPYPPLGVPPPAMANAGSQPSQLTAYSV